MNFQYTNPFGSGLFEGISNTPQKKVKLNEDSTFDHSKMKAPKLSILQRLNNSQKNEHKIAKF